MLSNFAISFIIGKICLLVIGLVFYQERIKIFFFKRRWFLCCMGERERDNCIYDIFLIYYHTDAEFVNQNIVPMIDKKYKVCELHRDPRMVPDVLYKAINESRRTVVIVSHQFAQDILEVQVFRNMYIGICHGRVFPRLVVVALDNVLKTDVLCAEYKRLLLRDKVVIWKSEQFWDKFRYALPHEPLLVEAVGENQMDVDTVAIVA